MGYGKIGNRARVRPRPWGNPCSRREFCRIAGGGLLSAALPASLFGCGSGETLRSAEPLPRSFRFAVLADTHIIDEFYEGPEGSPLDTESIFLTRDRLTAARGVINAIDPPVEMAFICGDFFHNYPSPDPDFYFENVTRLDVARELIDGFRMPVHPGFGNHDYDVPEIPRAVSHELFRIKFGVEPFYAVEHRGWKFLHVNNFLGESWDPGSPRYDRSVGSLGEEQLLWLEAHLRERKPTFVFLHYTLPIVLPREVADLGLHTLLRAYQENVQLVVSGHTHRWIPFGTLFGPPHLICAATRYDEDSFLVFEVDTVSQTWEILHADRYELLTHYSEPYPL